MIPILYDKDETAFASNGLGRLRDITRCEVTEERNGIYECEFEVPTSGAHFKDIICGRYIGVEHDESGDVQPFEIYSYSKPINGLVTFKAFHISYKQSKMTVPNGGAINDINDAFTLLKNSAIPDNPFEYETDIVSTAYMSGAEGTPKTVRQLLGGVQGSILDAYGGEYEWDRWTVRLWDQRGEVKDFVIRYGLNIIDYQDDADYSETYNAVIPYWQGQDDNGNELVVRGGKVTADGIMYDDTEACIPLDLTDKFEAQPTSASLETMAQSYLRVNQPTLPQQTIKVDFIRLKDMGEYEQFSALQRCRLCDSVRVVFPRYGMDGTYKIVKVVYDVLLERYLTMELGTLSTSLASALSDSFGSTSLPNQPSGVIATGTENFWKWRKWADGTAECWGYTPAASIACTTAWGSAYYSALRRYSFPTGLFIPYPTINATLYDAGGLGWVTISTWTKDNMDVYVSEPTSTTRNMQLCFHVSGRWK